MYQSPSSAYSGGSGGTRGGEGLWAKPKRTRDKEEGVACVLVAIRGGSAGWWNGGGHIKKRERRGERRNGERKGFAKSLRR